MASARNAPPKKVLKKSFNVPAFFSILVAYAHEFTGKRPFEADFPITAYQYLLEDFIMSAALITKEPLMTEHSLILPTIVANPLSLSAVPVR